VAVQGLLLPKIFSLRRRWLRSARHDVCPGCVIARRRVFPSHVIARRRVRRRSNLAWFPEEMASLRSSQWPLKGAMTYEKGLGMAYERGLARTYGRVLGMTFPIRMRWLRYAGHDVCPGCAMAKRRVFPSHVIARRRACADEAISRGVRVHQRQRPIPGKLAHQQEVKAGFTPVIPKVHVMSGKSDPRQRCRR